MSIGLEQLRAATPPGICPFCGSPAKRRSQSDTARQKRRKFGRPEHFGSCGEPECVKAYHRLYGRDRRRREREANGPSGPVVAVCNTRPSKASTVAGASCAAPG